MIKVNKIAIILSYNVFFTLLMFWGSQASFNARLIFSLYTFSLFALAFIDLQRPMKAKKRNKLMKSRFMLANIIDFVVFILLLFVGLVLIYSMPSSVGALISLHIIFGYFVISNIWFPSVGYYFQGIEISDKKRPNSIFQLYKKFISNAVSLIGLFGFFAFSNVIWTNLFFDYLTLIFLFLLVADVIYLSVSKKQNRLIYHLLGLKMK